MESRFRNIFLMLMRLACCLAINIGAVAWAQEADEPPQVIEPQVERRELDVGAIDTEDFELTGFIGIMSVEDFESGAVYGVRLAYHINEALFAEASIGTTKVGTSSYENLTPGASLTSDRQLTYYDLSLAWNIFPGEVFFGSNRAWNSSFYLIGGGGSTKFAGDNNFTINFGFGFKVLPTDYLAVRAEIRDYLFNLDITGTDKVTNNLQATINVSWFF